MYTQDTIVAISTALGRYRPSPPVWTRSHRHRQPALSRKGPQSSG